MNHDEFNQFCATFHGVSHVVQWQNSEVWKVAEKVFAIGIRMKGDSAAFTFKVSPLNYEFLREHDSYRPTPYFASRGMKWIQQVNSSSERDEELKYYLSESYRLVSQSLSKRKQRELGLIE